MPALAPVTTTTWALADGPPSGSAGRRSRVGRARSGGLGTAVFGGQPVTAASSSSACTKAWGRLPRSWRWATSNSSVNRPGRAARRRGCARTSGPRRPRAPCWWAASAIQNPQSRNAPSAWPSGRGVVAEAVDVAVLGQLGGAPRRAVATLRGSSAGTAPRIAGQQQRGVDPRVVGGALPAPAGVQAVGGGRRRRCASASASRQLAAAGAAGARRSRAARPRRSAGSAPSAGRRAPRCRRRARASAPRSRRPRRRAACQCSASRRSCRRGRGEQQQRLAERVELELGVDVVADDVGAARVAGQVERALVGHRVRRRRCRRAPGAARRRAAASATNATASSSSGCGAGGGDGLPGVALVADPDVAVVVVAALRRRARAGSSWPPRPSRPRRWSARAARRRRAGRRAAAMVSPSSGHAVAATPSRCAAHSCVRVGRRAVERLCRRAPGPGRAGLAGRAASARLQPRPAWVAGALGRPPVQRSVQRPGPALPARPSSSRRRSVSAA